MSASKTCSKCGKALAENGQGDFCPACLMRYGLESGTGPTHNPRGRAFTPPTPEELSQFFPGLEIIALLGRGGMGAVYKVRQKQLDRIAALKILPPDVAEDPSFAKRFEREAQALAKLNHPNIVTLYEFGKAEGLYFFLMEFVDGVNLRQLMSSGKIEPKEALAIVPQICEALQFAHDHGIVHRDIKPENLLLDKHGRIKIADFGIAKILDASDANSTSAASPGSPPEISAAAGTPQYMAPEQKSMQNTDHRADIYSLGVVFYELLTGELPGTKLQPPSRKVQIDVRLDEIVLRALEAKPEHRFQTAAAFRREVETVSESPAPKSASTPIHECACYTSTPEQLATFDGQMFLWRRKGDMRLDDRQLTLTRNGNPTIIPFGAIRDLSIGHYPRVMNLVGLDCISVTYRDGYTTRKLFVSPSESLFGSPSRFNQYVADWYVKIVAAITAATGHAPSQTPPEQLGVPRSNRWVVAMLLLPVAMAACFLVFIFSTVTSLRPPSAMISRTQGSEDELRYRVFWADAATVEKLVPGETRRPGQMLDNELEFPNPPAMVGSPVNTVSQTAEITGDVFGRLLMDSAKEPLILADRHEPFHPWPGTATSWSFSGRLTNPKVPSAVESGVGGASGMVGLQRKKGVDQLRTQLLVTQTFGSNHQSALICWEGKAPAANGARAFFMPFTRDDGSRKFLIMAFEVNTGGALARTERPHGSVITVNDNAILLADDNVDLHYVVYYAGNHFGTGGGVNFNAERPKAWTEIHSIRLENGRTFGLQRSSSGPDELTINGKDYDLRRGRVFVVRDDGTVDNLPLFPPLTTARMPVKLGQIIRQSAATANSHAASGTQAVAGESKQSNESPRQVAAEFLRRLKRLAEKKIDQKDIWELTTLRKTWSSELAGVWNYAQIRPVHQLGNAQQAMVLSDRFKDNAGQWRIFYAVLMLTDGKWLINSTGNRSPDDVANLIQGFMLSPGVKYDVRPDELIGDWRFPCASSLKLAADGTGVRVFVGPVGDRSEPQKFRWDVSGAIFRQHFEARPDKPDMPGRKATTETMEIRWVNETSFAVEKLDGEEAGNGEGFSRDPREPDAAAPAEQDAANPPTLALWKDQVAQLKALLKTVPVTTKYLADVFEHDATAPNSYRRRADVVALPIVPSENKTPATLPLGELLYTPGLNSFYVQWDDLLGGQLHYYGPINTLEKLPMDTDGVQKIVVKTVERLIFAGPFLEVDIRFLDLPGDYEMDPDTFELKSIRKMKEADQLVAPRVVAAIGQDVEFHAFANEAKTPLDPTPTGVAAKLTPTLIGDTVHFTGKFSICLQLDDAHPEVRTMREIASTGDVKLGKTAVVSFGKSKDGHLQYAILVFEKPETVAKRSREDRERSRPVFRLCWIADAPSAETEDRLLDPDEDETKPKATLHVEKKGLLDHRDLKSVVGFDDGKNGPPRIQIEFKEAGAKRLADATRDAKGRRMALIVYGRVVFAPTIASPIMGGKLVLTGNISKAAAKTLVFQIESLIPEPDAGKPAGAN